jgi:exopolysaccharide biosynthesis polyprenyl glycosylphosphotransferase
MHRRLPYIFLYAVLDVASSLIAWTLLYYFRKFFIEYESANIWTPFLDKKFFVGLLVIPQIWLLLYYLSGTYTDVFRKSRLQETIKTGIITLVGSVVIFFLFLLDDLVQGYKDYYFSFAVLMIAQLSVGLSFRMIYLNGVKSLMKRGGVMFNTLIVGSGVKASELTTTLLSKSNNFYHIIGTVANDNELYSSHPTSYLGSIEQLDKLIEEYDIEEIIIAIETEQHDMLTDIIHLLGDKNVFIKIVPDMYDILSRTVRMNHVMGEAFIEIPPTLIEEWERIQKRSFDIIASVLALLFTSPIILFTIFRIKYDSKGAAFYSQERLGQYGKPFLIYKLRTMYSNAEEQGPKLTADHDPRITKVGGWIRKYRIDELPQFWNVLKGEMSIVGPRAERAFFANQIEKRVPHYTHIFKVKPGITSLGMVKFGYASSVDEMIQRLKYDIIYIENMSMIMDLKILIYTVKTVVTGKGK